jgi:hypothetical protein
MQVHTRNVDGAGRRPVRRTAGLLAVGATLAASAVAATSGPSAVAAEQQPDLVVAKVGTPPMTVQHGTRFGLGAGVANRGDSAAPPTQLRFYLSKDRTRGTDDVLGGKVAVKRLAPGRTTTVSGSVSVPWEARGKYWVLACADSNKSVRETKEANNCRISKSQVEVDADLHAELSGTLTFLDEGTDDDGVWTEAWHHTGSAQVTFAIDGDPAGDPTFASVESTYDRHGTRTARSESADCVSERTRDESGSGELVYEGDPFTDDINGSFTRTDLSGVRIGLFMRADWIETATQTGQGEFPCDPSSTTTNGTGLIVTDIELKEISATGDEIHYRVKSWLGDMGTTSDWDKVEGELTLTLR